MVQLIVNGSQLELKSETGIKYNMQISDVFNLSVVVSNYTNSFTIPKTPHNTQVFQQLGIIGDTSTIPYEKIEASLHSNGFPVIVSGWLSIRETTESYNVSIIDGMIDFFKAIENKTIGSDLDLTNFNHEKNMATVIDSFTNDYYKYIVADYNGKNFGQVEEESGINIDYLVPCFSVRKLWELIFATFGFTCDYTNLSDFIDGLYITYPKDPAEGSEPELIATANKTNWISSNVANWQGQKYVPSQEFWSATSPSIPNWGEWTYTISATESYVLEAQVEAYVKLIHPVAGAVGDYPATINILVNGSVVASMPTDPFTQVILSTTQYLTEGDVVQIRLSGAPPDGYSLQFRHLNTNFNIYSIDLGDVVLVEAFKDFQIKDFIKEIIWRTALIPIINNRDKDVSFIPLSERLDFSNAIDWSWKYIRRIKEGYVQDGYAQKNIFKLNHNNPVDTRGDGYLYVNNKNLKDEQILAASKIYAPETFKAQFESVNEGELIVKTDTYKVWEREAKTNEEGEIEIEYKGLSNRFYFVRHTAPVNIIFKFVSEVLADVDSTSFVPFAINNQTLFDELVFQNYAGYDGVLNNFRMHEIQLALTELDILQMDMTKPHYIEKEGQYYLVNKVTWESGKTSVAECIRINKV